MMNPFISADNLSEAKNIKQRNAFKSSKISPPFACPIDPVGILGPSEN